MSYAVDYYIKNKLGPPVDGWYTIGDNNYVDPRSKEAVEEMMGLEEFRMIIEGNPKVMGYSNAWKKINRKVTELSD